jgi:hypothetical protein
VNPHGSNNMDLLTVLGIGIGFIVTVYMGVWVGVSFYNWLSGWKSRE